MRLDGPERADEKKTSRGRASSIMVLRETVVRNVAEEEAA
jgi:hypothetical protein